MDYFFTEKIQPKYSSHLFSESARKRYYKSRNKPITYDGRTTEEVDARLILRDNFDAIFSKYPETLIFEIQVPLVM